MLFKYALILAKRKMPRSMYVDGCCIKVSSPALKSKCFLENITMNGRLPFVSLRIL